jgi:hypothetical protein
VFAPPFLSQAMSRQDGISCLADIQGEMCGQLSSASVWRDRTNDEATAAGDQPKRHVPGFFRMTRAGPLKRRGRFPILQIMRAGPLWRRRDFSCHVMSDRIG